MPSICELKERVRELEREVERERTCNLQHGHRYADSEIARLRRELVKRGKKIEELEPEVERLGSLLKNAEAALVARVKDINRLQNDVLKRDTEIKNLKGANITLAETLDGSAREIMKLRNTYAATDENRARYSEELFADAEKLRARLRTVTEKGPGPTIGRMTEKIKELEEALEGRIKEVKMLRGWHAKERNDRTQAYLTKIKKLEFETTIMSNHLKKTGHTLNWDAGQLCSIVGPNFEGLRAELKAKTDELGNLKKADDWACLVFQREIEKLEATIKRREQHATIFKPTDYEIRTLRQVNAQIQQTCQGQTIEITRLTGQVTYWKATAAKRLEAIEAAGMGRCTKYEKAVLEFCKWVETETGANGYQGYNLIGKLQWAQKVLLGRVIR